MRLRETPRSRQSRSRVAAAAASRRLTSAGDCSGGSGVFTKPASARRRGWRAALRGRGRSHRRRGRPPGPDRAGLRGHPADPRRPVPDGPNDRWLLGGAWLYRADPTNAGLTAGWWRNVRRDRRLEPGDGPQFLQRGRPLGRASMAGSVGWYRRDFTIPPKALRRPMCRRASAAGSSASNRSTTAPRCGSTAAGSELTPARTCRSSSTSKDCAPVSTGWSSASTTTGRRRPPARDRRRWWNFGGINQEVYLRSVQAADMSPVVIRPLLPARRAPLDSGAGHRAQRHRRGADGRPARDLRQFGGELRRHTIAAGGTWVARAR